MGFKKRCDSDCYINVTINREIKYKKNRVKKLCDFIEVVTIASMTIARDDCIMRNNLFYLHRLSKIIVVLVPVV